MVGDALCAFYKPGPLTHVQVPAHDLWLGWEVRDMRGADGGYSEKPAFVLDGIAVLDADNAALWLSILQSAGPVVDDADAVARIQAFLALRLGLDSRLTGPLAIGSVDGGAGAPTEERCGVVGDAKRGYTATLLRADIQACLCVETWSNTIRVVVRLGADGKLVAEDALVACTVRPESARAEVCKP